VAAVHHSAFGEDAFGHAAERTARFFGTPQRDKSTEADVERRHDEMERRRRRASKRYAPRRRSSSSCLSPTELTRQDKALTEQVADLTKQIHALLTATPPRA
jgi:hypothetical protein